MSNTVHYTPDINTTLRKMLRAIPCGIGHKDRELDMSNDPAQVDCQKCLAVLRERKREGVERG